MKTHGIDLRATSSQPFNTQPVTFKERLEPLMGSPAVRIAFMGFYDTALAVNAMTSAEAAEALAVTFAMCRVESVPGVKVAVAAGMAEFYDLCDHLADFVDQHSDGGRVGQALCAALLDVTYGLNHVTMGAINDPDSTIVGDVHAWQDGIWLWCEVKQKVVGTGDVESFMQKVSAVGGERVLYLALKNSEYAVNISPRQVEKEAAKLGVACVLVLSPSEAIEILAAAAPGSFTALASGLLERVRARLVESKCIPDILAAFDDMASSHGDLIPEDH